MAVVFLNVAMIRAADTPGLWSGRRSCERGFGARLRSCAWSWCAPRRRRRELDTGDVVPNAPPRVEMDPF